MLQNPNKMKRAGKSLLQTSANNDKHSEYDFSAPHSITRPKFVQNFLF